MQYKAFPLYNKKTYIGNLVFTNTTRSDLHLTRIEPLPASCSMAENVKKNISLDKINVDIEALHYPLMRFKKDQNSNLHKLLYRTHFERENHYSEICKWIVSHILNEPAYVQVMPCYRVGFPLNRWVGCFHRDSDFGHSAAEINFICALTAMAGSSALQVEDYPGSFSYISMDLLPGELISFDHIDRLHGCKRNKTGEIVISMDFRFIPLRLSAQAFSFAASTVNTKMALLPGSYFSSEPLLP